MSSKYSHKGKSRQFSTVEEIQEQLNEMNLQGSVSEESDYDSDSDDLKDNEQQEEKPRKPKGVEGLLPEIQNPNRNPCPPPDGKVELSRRERERLEKMKKDSEWPKLLVNQELEAQLDEELKKDLERLRLIRKQREEANQKRLMEQKEKENEREKARAKAAAIQKQLALKLASGKKR